MANRLTLIMLLLFLPLTVVAQNSKQQPGALTPQMRKWILEERDKVWRAFFANDTIALNKLIPEDFVAMDEGGDFQNRANIFAAAKHFAESGGKLISLEFPHTEIQLYGNTVFIYTTYKTVIEFGDKRNSTTGRATENFVIRDGTLVNVGWHVESKKD